jgi:hypothetical protein
MSDESKISTGISKMHKHENSISYVLSCHCASPDCAAIIDMEFDKEYGGIISITFYKEFYFFYPTTYTDEILEKIKNWWKGIWWRISSAFKILFIGHIQISSDMTIDPEEHIDDFIKALQEGRDYCKEARKKWQKN